MTDVRSVDTAPQVTRLEAYTPYAYRVDSVDLRFELHPTATRVTQTSRFERVVHDTTALELYGLNLTRLSVQIDGEEVSADRLVEVDETLLIRQVPPAFTLTVVTEINPEANTALEGLYLSNGMFCTQCEAEGFRRITYYPDRPDVMSVFTTTVVAPADYPVLLSNGNPMSETVHADGSRDVVWHDPFPNPCYLFALVGGQLALATDTFVTRSGRSVELRIYVDEKDLNRVDYALESLKRAMAWDEEAFGREYDLDIFMIVAVSHFNMGAMENKGLNIFNSSCVLANPDAATDQAFQRIEAIIAHEYFHNWSGNRVTCRDWFQLSLKEGFTVFRDSEFSADINSRAVKRIQDVNFLRSAQFTEDAGPTAHPVQPSEYLEISNFYTLTIYEKGAEIVRMLKTLLGAAQFRAGSDLYFARHDGQAVTIEDFVAAMAEVSGRDLSQFMRWYRQPGTPVLHVEDAWDADTRMLTLRFKQRPPAIATPDSHQAYVIPVSYQVFDRTSGTVLVPERLLELHSEGENVAIHLPDGDPVVSMLRGLSAPVRLAYDRSLADYAAVALHDDDGVSRWDAMQALYLKAIAEQMTDAGRATDMVVEVLGGLLSAVDEIRDPACMAEMLMLPQDNILWDAFQPADPQALVAARKRLRHAIAEALLPVWPQVYRAMQVSGPYQPEAHAIGCRSLGLAALGFWARAADVDAELAYLFDNASNLTERFAAYRIARSDGSPALGERLSEAFLASADTDEVLDLWLSTEAVNESTATLARVQELTEHTRFAWTNPNRVRAVIGAFSARNVKSFHTEAGYRYVRDVIVKLDAMNPQIAARLVNPLCQWSRLTPEYANAMCAELESMAVMKLSKDLYEIVDKSRRKESPKN